jgi:hypothetical protein
MRLLSFNSFPSHYLHASIEQERLRKGVRLGALEGLRLKYVTKIPPRQGPIAYVRGFQQSCRKIESPISVPNTLLPVMTGAMPLAGVVETVVVRAVEVAVGVVLVAVAPEAAELAAAVLEVELADVVALTSPTLAHGVMTPLPIPIELA